MSADPRADCFVDTNILVYAFDRSAGQKHTIAAQFVKALWENETGCISIQVLQEFFVNVTRKIASPLEHQTARQIVADLGLWRVHSPDVSDLLQAVDFQKQYPLSFWDAMIMHSAARLNCKQLLSEDLNDGQVYGNVRVINPFTGRV
jgi:predicted nucleic acid-binding protein